MDFEKMISEFRDNHPVWAWILARLVICTCICAIVGIVFFAVIVIFAPFVVDDVSLAVWFWLPLMATACWLLCSIVGIVWCEVIE